MSKFTPGPWAVSDKIPQSMDRWNVVSYQGRGFHNVAAVFESKEDAELISAAPDMLEALTHIHRVLMEVPKAGVEEYEAAIRKIESAIKKAEGKL